jgi:hypothetical protein
MSSQISYVNESLHAVSRSLTGEHVQFHVVQEDELFYYVLGCDLK